MSATRSSRNTALLAVLLSPLLLVTACNGSEVLDTGNTAFVVEVPIINPEDRFDLLALMLVSQINVRPNNPDADASLGPRPIGVLSSTEDLIEIDFSDPSLSDPSTLVLSSGSYRISTLQLANLLLVATRPDPLEWDTCEEFFAWTFPVGIIEFDAEDLGNLGNFSVPAGGAGVLTIGFDATAFIEAYTNTWICTPPPNPVPIQFDEAAFKALAPTYLTIRSTSVTP